MDTIITYDDFVKKLNDKVKSDEDFCYELLVTVIKNPNRYTGIFRLSNAKTKLVQNVTQSREIKFGDFMEDIITDYFGMLGYKNINKIIGVDEEGNTLNADQVFTKGNVLYLIEQKIRDDHDSTKKRGQFLNFRKKLELLKYDYLDKHLIAIMWFIDDSLKKNKKYYKSEADKVSYNNVEIKIMYGGELFDDLFDNSDVWNEINSHLSKNKEDRNDEVLTIPDFDTSNEMFEALKKLKKSNKTLFKKLVSDKGEYIQLRKELFPTGFNIRKVINEKGE